jgi:predicted enzyme related to lactoylglutathione lyase
MEMTHNAIGWFEIPVADFERARAFYGNIFDFEMPVVDMGPVKMGIFLHDRVNGGVGGAIVAGEGYVPSKTGAKVYLNAGADLTVCLNRVVPSGGRIVIGKTSVGEMGFIAIVEDTEGNYVSLHSIQ